MKEEGKKTRKLTTDIKQAQIFGRGSNSKLIRAGGEPCCRNNGITRAKGAIWIFNRRSGALALGERISNWHLGHIGVHIPDLQTVVISDLVQTLEENSPQYGSGKGIKKESRLTR